ncbi:hypothetical protein ACFE04_026298 [Oxalis oulophora]
MAIEEDIESCGSRAAAADLDYYSLSSSQANSNSGNNPRHHRQKLEVYTEVLRRIQESQFNEAILPGFDDQLWLHFNRLPARYALDVNVERAEDVLMHKRLLQLAEDPANRPAFEVHLVQVYPIPNGNCVDSTHLDCAIKEDAQSSYQPVKQGVHPPPTFGSSPNLEALALQVNRYHHIEDGDSAVKSAPQFSRPMHEITFSTVDKPKLLSQLTALLAEIGLNIQEAHAFSTVDGYSLDVFVVDGWPREETEELRTAVEKEVLKSKDQTSFHQQAFSAVGEQNKTEINPFRDCIEIPTDGTDVWEIDSRQLKIESKVASGSYGDLYRGIYCSQEVAIKILKPERVNADMLRDFAQEVYIMRKIRHKNVVQFMGACTRPPNLCIVTEFMARGSIYDFLHKLKGMFKLPSLLKVAIDISKGMDYLHQNNIIHRDLKTANLLMDENELPYMYLTPLQAAVGVVQKGLRPTIPKQTHPRLTELLEKCWQQDPTLRPNFSEIIVILQQLAKEVTSDKDNNRPSPGFFSALRKGLH